VTGSAVFDFIKAEQLWRAGQAFFVFDIAYLIIAIVIASFVIKKYTANGAGKFFSPARFAFIVITVLGTSAVLSVYWGLNYSLFALAFGMGGMLSCIDPVAAVAFLLANLLMRPWEMSNMESMGFIPKALGLLSLASWFFNSARAKRLTLLFNRPSKIFFALTIWFLISALSSGDFMAGLTDYSNTMMISTIIFVLVSNVPETEGDLGLLEKVLVLAITGSISHALLVTVTQDNYNPFFHRLEDTGLTGNSNDLAALIVQALPFAVIPALLAKGRLGSRILMIFTLPILITGLLLSQSRGAMLGVVVSIGTYFIFKAKKRRRAFFLAALFVPVLFLFFSLANMVRSSQDLQGSTESRTSFLIAGLNMGAHHPLMGVGFGNFPKQWQSYSIGAVYEEGVHTAHNSWILAFAETGLPGLLLLIGLFVSTTRRAVKLQSTHPELISAMMGYGVAMTFLSHTYTFFPYLLFALVLAAGKLSNCPT
jgi:O-antigen ligase